MPLHFENEIFSDSPLEVTSEIEMKVADDSVVLKNLCPHQSRKFTDVVIKKVLLPSGCNVIISGGLDVAHVDPTLIRVKFYLR